MKPQDFKYEKFFELSPDLLCIAGYDGYFKKINPAVSKLLGYTEAELFAKPINYFVYEGDKDITSKMRSELIKAKPLLNFENRYLTKTGEIVWLSWTSHPVEEEQLIFAIAKNITHKKTHEAERNAQIAQLTEVNKDLKQLNYTTSHDLRSPVNNLLSVFDMIDPTKISDHETLELIEVLKCASEKLKHTLNNYVDVLTEKHESQNNLEQINFAECLGNVMASINALVEVSGTTIHANFKAVGQIKFNKTYLESIFLNLVTNAIKYAKPGELPVIHIYTDIVNGTNKLIVEDNGQGFDMTKVEDKIFGLNQKFHNHSDSKGIGLYLVFSHVTSLGGKIHVDSKINQGSRFTISFKD